MIIKNLKNIYFKQMFFPGWLGVFTNPFYFARLGLSLAMSEFADKLSGRLLDVGCGSKPYKSLFVVEDYVGLDIDSENTRLSGTADKLYDGKDFPFEDNSFDSVLCNQVLEHVFNPQDFLSEINRVLKPGGRLLLTVPFVWDEHEQPYDFARYSTFGLRALLEGGGFKFISHKKLGADVTCIFQLINAYIFKVTQHWPRLVNLLLAATVMAFFNLLGIFLKTILPDNPDLFLDHVVLVENTK